MSLQEFAQLLKDAYLDQNQMKTYESILIMYKMSNQNLCLALKKCSQIIVDVEFGSNLRAAAMQQLLNYMRHSRKYIQPPLRIIENLHNFVRNRGKNIFTNVGLMDTLKVCAQITADVPPSQQTIIEQIWEFVISYIIHDLQQINRQINYYTVVYISAGLKSTSKIKIDEFQTLFQKNYQGLIKKDKLHDLIIQTLKCSLDLIANDDEALDYFKGLLLNLILSKNVQMRDIALNVVIHFNKLAFRQLPLYIFELQLTTTRYFKLYPQLAMLAIQIWIEITNKIQRDISKNQTSQSLSTLLQFFKDKCDEFIHPILENLLITDGDNEDGDIFPEVSRQKSSYQLLVNILDITDQAGHQKLIQFIGYTINFQDKNYQNAACLAIAALSERVDRGSIRGILYDNVAAVADLLNVSIVRIGALNAIQIIAINYPETLINNVRSQQILKMIISTLQNSVYCLLMPLNILFHMTQNIEDYKESFIYRNRHHVMSSIAKVLVRPEVIVYSDVDMIDKAFQSMLFILYSINDKHILKAYLCQFMVKLIELLDEEGVYIEEMQSGLSSCIHVFIIQLQNKNQNNKKKGCLVKMDVTDLTDQEAQEIVKVCQSGQLVKKSDMFYILGGIAQCQKLKIAKYVEIILMQISSAIQDLSDISSFKAALFCLNDVSKALMKEFKPYRTVILYLSNLFMDPEFDKELKTQIIDTIGFVILSLDNESHIYMSQLKAILHQGIADCVKFQQENNISYAEKLKEALIGYYYTFIQTFENYNYEPHIEIEDTIFPVFRFIRIVCDKKYKNNIQFIKKCVDLIVDIASGYESSQKLNSIIKPFITNEFFLNLIREISKTQDDECQQSVNLASEILDKKYNFKLQL